VTLLSDPHTPGTARDSIPVPSVKAQLSIGVHSGWTCASSAGSMLSGTPPVPYGESTPRSFRLSMMLLRARFAVIAS
jgi:hypothetical protein